MRKGLMQDYANQIAQMFIGYQITLVDLPRLVEAGHGVLEVDLLGDRSRLNERDSPPFSITAAVRSWLDAALIRDQLSADSVQRVLIHLDFEIEEIQGGAQSDRTVHFDCRVDLDATNGAWVGTSRNVVDVRADGPQAG